MKRNNRRGILSLVLAIVLMLCVQACSNKDTVTITTTEAELNERQGSQGFTTDLQPGQMVLSGNVDGADIELVITLAAQNGSVAGQLADATVNGQPVPTENFQQINETISNSLFVPPDSYVENVTITDDEIILEITPQ